MSALRFMAGWILAFYSLFIIQTLIVAQISEQLYRIKIAKQGTTELFWTFQRLQLDPKVKQANTF